MRSESILQPGMDFYDRECFLTGIKDDSVVPHHIYRGCNRKISDENGLWVWLSGLAHTISENSAHKSHETELYLQKLCQKKYEETHTREEFMKLIGKNFLED